MPRADWERLYKIDDVDEVEIDLSTTPIAEVACSSQFVAAMARRVSARQVAIDVYRLDPKDAPRPINVDRYLVSEELPAQRDYLSMVNEASTEDNSNMRGSLKDEVFFTKYPVTPGHRLAELPPRVRAILEGRMSCMTAAQLTALRVAP